jgi:hypothetical protein
MPERETRTDGLREGEEVELAPEPVVVADSRIFRTLRTLP